MYIIRGFKIVLTFFLDTHRLCISET